MLRITAYLPLLFALCFTLGAVAPLHAQDGDPSEMFLRAYMSAQQGEKFAAQGKYKEARARLRFASSLLEQLSVAYPDWQRVIVVYRSKKIADLIVDVEGRMSLDELSAENNEPPAGRAPSTVESGVTRGDTVRRATPVTPGDEMLPTQPGMPQPFPGETITAPAPTAGSSRAVIQLKAEIEDLTEELNTLRSNSADGQAMKKALEEKAALEAKLAKQQAEVEKQLAKAKEDAEDAATKAKTEADKALETVKAEAEKARAKQMEAAEKEKTDLQKQIEENAAKFDTATQNLETSTKQLEEAQAAITKAAENEATLRAELEKGTETIRMEKLEMADRLTAARFELAALAVERDALMTDLTNARTELGAAQSKLAEAEKLRQENTKLLGRLEEFEKRFKDLKNDPNQLHQQLETARTELATLKEELDATKARNAENDATINDLKLQLDTLNTELTKAKISGGDNVEAGRIVEENQLLRDIVLRQLKEERRRTEMGKILMSEVMKIENRSDLMMSKLEELTRPIIQLTEEERKMFRLPTITVSDEQFDSMAVSIALNKPVVNPVVEANTAAAAAAAEASATAMVPGSSGESTTDPLPTESTTGGEVTGDFVLSSAAATATAPGPVVETTIKPKVPSDLMPLAEEAKEAFDRGQYRKAEQAYEKILARAPDNLYALSNLGVVHFRDGKLRQAELTLKKATAVAPNDAFSHTTLGIVYFNLNKYDEAIEVLTKSITIDPRNAQSHNYLGITASMKGWPEAAEEEIQKAIALNPDYADAHFNLAVIYATQDPPMRELARRHYDKAISLGAATDPMLDKLVENP